MKKKYLFIVGFTVILALLAWCFVMSGLYDGYWQNKWEAGYGRHSCVASIGLEMEDIGDSYMVGTRLSMVKVLNNQDTSREVYKDLKKGDMFLSLLISLSDYRKRYGDYVIPFSVVLDYGGRHAELFYVPPEKDDEYSRGAWVLISSDVNAIWDSIKQKKNITLKINAKETGLFERELPSTGIDTVSAMFDACYFASQAE
jgi:hypothetical protein